ncbi:hypothetical protein [Flavobacterium algicola]|uniref:hypothetical protein n=1 Tax=Flavobacterium algicola TaxID=556529 RepID=UPI001EFE6233|nr:hypothetical protein [Flavobacterium algicola]MCG9791216.1 hypothetical protein [Flavobacterium algicola]
MTTHSIQMFLKFGEEKHINDLYHNGTIFMNPIQYFRKIEDGELRGDKYEGISKITNLPPGQFEIPSLNFKGNYLALQYRESYDIVLGNIFSLYCISSHGWNNPNDFKIDEKIKNFGSHCLVITDNAKFLSLIEEKLIELKVKFRHNFIKYYDKDKVNRTISLFEKPLEFEYQKEFRFYVERKSEKPFSFSIGSLKDIAEIYIAIDIVNTLKLKIKEDIT